VAAALAPLAGMANGARENIIQVTVNEKTLTPEVRATMLNAKSLAIVAGDRSAIKAADLFESRGGYTVTIDRPTAKVGEMTGSERRETLKKLCATNKVDVAMMGRTIKTETGNMMIGALTGRAKVKNDWVLDLLACRTNTAMSFGGNFEMDLGVYNQKAESEYEELVGAEIGNKVLEALGRGNGAQVADGSQASAQKTVSDIPPQERSTATSGVTPSTGTANNPMSPKDIQNKLISLGYLNGKADGVLGKTSVGAIKKFQQDNGLPATGNVDSETQVKIRAATTRTSSVVK
jgi:hypothetical protein